MTRFSTSALRKKFDEFRTKEFPPDSDDEDLSGLRAEVALYDSFVAGQVESAISAGSCLPIDTRIDDNLRIRLEEYRSRSSGHLAVEAENLLAYVIEIEGLLVALRSFKH